MKPIAPQYTPLDELSLFAMLFIEATFGAPVMDAEGKSASKISTVDLRLLAETVLVI